MNHINTIKEPLLRKFINTHVISNVCVSGQEGGYVIIVRHGSYQRTLISSRGLFRLFTLDNAAKYLHSIGFSRFEVDASGFVPGRIRSPRPDRAAALKGSRSKSQQHSLI